MCWLVRPGSKDKLCLSWKELTHQTPKESTGDFCRIREDGCWVVTEVKKKKTYRMVISPYFML